MSTRGARIFIDFWFPSIHLPIYAEWEALSSQLPPRYVLQPFQLQKTVNGIEFFTPMHSSLRDARAPASLEDPNHLVREFAPF